MKDEEGSAKESAAATVKALGPDAPAAAPEEIPAEKVPAILERSSMLESGSGVRSADGNVAGRARFSWLRKGISSFQEALPLAVANESAGCLVKTAVLCCLLLVLWFGGGPLIEKGRSFLESDLDPGGMISDVFRSHLRHKRIAIPLNEGEHFVAGASVWVRVDIAEPQGPGDSPTDPDQAKAEEIKSRLKKLKSLKISYKRASDEILLFGVQDVAVDHGKSESTQKDANTNCSVTAEWFTPFTEGSAEGSLGWLVILLGVSDIDADKEACPI